MKNNCSVQRILIRVSLQQNFCSTLSKLKKILSQTREDVNVDLSDRKALENDANNSNKFSTTKS